MKKFLAIFALAGVVGVSACAAEDNTETEVLGTPDATTPPVVVDPAPIVVDSVPPIITDSVVTDSVVAP